MSQAKPMSMVWKNVISQGGTVTNQKHKILIFNSLWIYSSPAEKAFWNEVGVRSRRQNQRALDASYQAPSLSEKFHIHKKQTNNNNKNDNNNQKPIGRPDSGKQGFHTHTLIRSMQLNVTEANRGGRKGWIPLLPSLFTAKDRTLCHLGNSQQRQCVKL